MPTRSIDETCRTAGGNYDYHNLASRLATTVTARALATSVRGRDRAQLLQNQLRTANLLDRRSFVLLLHHHLLSVVVTPSEVQQLTLTLSC